MEAVMLRKLHKGDVGFMLVDAAFEWGGRPRLFMSIAEVCRASGFEPTPGDCVSVSAFLRRKGVERIRQCGERGAVMPPLRAVSVAKTTPTV
jgi:hypothetical protein